MPRWAGRNTFGKTIQDFNGDPSKWLGNLSKIWYCGIYFKFNSYYKIYYIFYFNIKKKNRVETNHKVARNHRYDEINILSKGIFFFLFVKKVYTVEVIRHRKPIKWRKRINKYK